MIRILRRNPKKRRKVDKEKIYELLINAHHYTPNQIANMTLLQIKVALKAISVYASLDERVFSSMSEYLAWKAGNGR